MRIWNTLPILNCFFIKFRLSIILFLPNSELIYILVRTVCIKIQILGFFETALLRMRMRKSGTEFLSLIVFSNSDCQLFYFCTIRNFYLPFPSTKFVLILGILQQNCLECACAQSCSNFRFTILFLKFRLSIILFLSTSKQNNCLFRQ